MPSGLGFERKDGQKPHRAAVLPGHKVEGYGTSMWTYGAFVVVVAVAWTVFWFVVGR